MIDYRYIYPDAIDLARPPTSTVDRLRAQMSDRRTVWTPDAPIDPPSALAVIGAIVFSFALRAPLAWDGQSLRARPGDPPIVLEIAAAQMVTGTLKGAPRWLVRRDNASLLSFPPHTASKMWAGRVSIDDIWTSNVDALGYLIDLDAASNNIPSISAALTPDNINAILAQRDDLTLKTVLPSSTGYDPTTVAIASRDGFSATKHPDIHLVGHQPARELLGLIGAAYIEADGRWISPQNVAIPVLDGVLLRDRHDLDRYMAIAPSMRCSSEQSGQRSYLVW